MIKHKNFVPTLKSFSLVLLAGAALLMAACSNIGDDASYGGIKIEAGGVGGSAQAATLKASVAFPGLPAVEQSAAVEQTGVSKSAFPAMPASTDTYFSYSATLDDGAGGVYSGKGHYNSSTLKYEFDFIGAVKAAEQTYTLTVAMNYSTGPATPVAIARGQSQVTVPAAADSFDAGVRLNPTTDSGYNGSISLPVKFDDADITSVDVKLIDSDGFDRAYNYLSDLSFSVSGGIARITSNVTDGLPAGIYTLLMTFYKTAQVVGGRTETVSVFGGMETNQWWTGSGSALTLAISEAQAQTEYWVRGTGGAFYAQDYASGWSAADTNSGDFFAPLQTIQKAVDLIEANGDTTTQYTIYVDGTISAGDSPEFKGTTDPFKSLAYISAARKIKISGYSGSDKDIIDCNSKCRGITVASAVIEISNLSITNGGDVSNGGALYVGGGTGTAILSDGALINKNQCTENGGGIYSNGNLYICGSAVVGDYSASMSAAQSSDCGNSCGGNGGGISSSGNLYLGYSAYTDAATNTPQPLTGGVYRNYAKNGGGINSTGSVFAASGCISYNGASSAGGGIYNNGTIKIGGEAYIPAGDDGKNDVYMASSTTIQVASPLTATTTPVATITPSSYTPSKSVVTLADSSTATLADELSKFAVTPNDAGDWSVVANAAGDAGVLRPANSASGGVTVSLGGGVSFVITKPTAESLTASFTVMDGTEEAPAADLSGLQIKILNSSGSELYSAAAQTVTASYLPDGSYNLYCHAVYNGIDYDTTVTFTIGSGGTVGLSTPLTLEAIDNGTTVYVVFRAPSSSGATPIRYKINDGEPQEIARVSKADNVDSESTDYVQININAGDKVCFYGDNPRYSSRANNLRRYSRIAPNKDCYVYGNVMSLINSSDFENEKTLTEEYALAGLFRNETGDLHKANVIIKPGADLFLPAETLSDYCYASMFYNNDSLDRAPELNATTLADGCYKEMFSGCTSLTNPPSLPATTMAYNCYSYMFMKSGLTSVPALGAENLAEWCYYGMFTECNGLTTVPTDLLKATVMADGCYWSMFNGCENLQNAPDLPAGTLAKQCYNEMFSGCKSLTSPPALNAITLAEECYSYMFYGSGLTSAPALPAATLAPGCYTNMFQNCKSLTSVGENYFSSVTATAHRACYAMFSGSGLTSAPKLPVAPMTNSSYYEYYDDDGGVHPNSYYGQMFKDCVNLATLPSGMFPAITLGLRCYEEMFSGCTSLETFPTLPAGDDPSAGGGGSLGVACYKQMFEGCTKLKDTISLQATNLNDRCYMGMFKGCTSLTIAADLPATTLESRCYQEMFSGCTSLNSVTCMAEDISAEDCLTDWLKDTTGGVLTGALTLAQWGYYVPSAWTIVTE
ncbi:MAG: leucine-rich repeat protein [Treponema sp.]|nr:leucine-rich repeat protein [Treponema sp.]